MRYVAGMGHVNPGNVFRLNGTTNLIRVVAVRESYAVQQYTGNPLRPSSAPVFARDGHFIVRGVRVEPSKFPKPLLAEADVAALCADFEVIETAALDAIPLRLKELSPHQHLRAVFATADEITLRSADFEEYTERFGTTHPHLLELMSLQLMLSWHVQQAALNTDLQGPAFSLLRDTLSLTPVRAFVQNTPTSRTVEKLTQQLREQLADVVL